MAFDNFESYSWSQSNFLWFDSYPWARCSSSAKTICFPMGQQSKQQIWLYLRSCREWVLWVLTFVWVSDSVPVLEFLHVSLDDIWVHGQGHHEVSAATFGHSWDVECWEAAQSPGLGRLTWPCSHTVCDKLLKKIGWGQEMMTKWSESVQRTLLLLTSCNISA